MSILVTGIGGHIGSNVARMLMEAGNEVVGVDVVAPGPHSVIAGFAGKLTLVQGSVTDLAFLLNVVRERRVESVLHTAVIQAEHADARPLEAIRVNIEGTLNVLEAARIAGLRRVVCCSSSAAAGEHRGRPLPKSLKESDIDWPFPSVYALTKHTNEGQVHLYRRLYGVDAMACRPARVWGPGYNRWDLAPPVELLVRNAVAGKPILLQEGGDTLLDYTYVKDLAAGLIRALKVGSTKSAVFNLSGGRLVSLFEIAAVLRTVFPDQAIEVGPGQVDLSSLRSAGSGGYRMALRPAFDVSLARAELGYQPEYCIERGIPAYVAWLRNREYL